MTDLSETDIKARVQRLERREFGHGMQTPEEFTGIGHADLDITESEDFDKIFGSNGMLQKGDTVHIHRPDSSYIIEDWLDVDVDHVTIRSAGQFARDGSPLVKVADGANVGGLRVGNNRPVTDFTLEVFGYDGNHTGQDQSVKRLHGVQLVNVTDFDISGVHTTRTSPYHEHGSGGSGISVRGACGEGTIENCWSRDIGDRAVQCAGDDVQIERIRNFDGYDRTVACGLTSPSGEEYANDITIQNIYAKGTEDGSTVGMGGSSGVVVDTVLTENTTRGASLKVMGSEDVRASNIVGRNCGSAGTGGVLEINDLANTPSDIVVDGVYAHNPDGGNAVILNAGTNIRVSDITIREAGFHGIVVDNAGVVIDSVDIETTSGAGIRVKSNPDYINNVTMRSTGGANVYIEGTVTGPVELRDVSQGVDVTNNAVQYIYNGDTTETTDAEVPQGTYPVGTFVDFTDAGDASGDGYYRIDRTGTPRGPL